MKLVIDEKLKHRLIGLAVVFSIAAIFAPAMIKKSNQNMENKYSVRVKLPSKPTAPNVAVSDEKEVFRTIKIAKVKIPEVSSESQLPQLARAEVLHSEISTQHETAALAGPAEKNNSNKIELAQNTSIPLSEQQQLAVNPSTKPKAQSFEKKPLAPLAKKTQNHKVAQKTHASTPFKAHKDIYAVQLASFIQVENAQALVNKLKSKGYKANYAKLVTKNGAVYKVYAGHSPEKVRAEQLKTQLANAMQLKGFVVTTGVS